MRSSYTVVVRKGSYTLEAWTIVLIHCWVSSTIMIPTPWKHGEVPTTWKCGMSPTPWKHKRLCCSVVGYRAPQQFLRHGSVERVLQRVTIEDCADLLLGIEHHNESYAVEAGRNSYNMVVWKGSYAVEIEDCAYPLLGIV